MEERPLDETVAAAQHVTAPHALLRDGWFWLALLLGIVACEVFALFLGRGREIGSHAGQWQQLLWLAVIYPVVEEWVFRGVIQPRLWVTRMGRQACCRISLANLMTTLLFAAFHLFSHTPLWAALVILPSLVFGTFRDRYNSILPGTLLHGGYNLAFFLIFGLPG